jgi:cell division protein FtsW
MSAHDEYAGGASSRYLLLGATVFLSAFGLVMIYSASSISALVREGSSQHFMLRQALFLLLGVLVCGLTARLDYRLFRDRWAQTVWYGSVGLLVITIGLGVVRGGAKRWIPLGIFNLQPSELAKIACVLLASAVVYDWQRGKMDSKQLLVRIAVVAGVPSALIIMQPDLGTTLSLVVAVAFVLFLGGIELKWVGVTGAAVIALGGIGVALEPYRMKRFAGYLDPWADPLHKGYQAIQALMAFGTGGIQGVGLGLSRQKWFYLPEAHTDFIFAMVGEELGLIGTLAVLAAFIVLLYAGVRIALGSRDRYGRLVAGSLTGMLGFQALLNMGAVTGLIPVTGKPLPFVSYGGSSMLVTMICVGLILSVSQYGAKAPREVRVRPRNEEPRRESGAERGRDGRPRVSRVDGGRRTRRRA